MLQAPAALLLLATVICANHQARLSDDDIAVIQTNYKAMTNRAEYEATAAVSRDKLKAMYIEDAMAANASRKRAVVETEAEEWLETIQQAKRAVHASMGIPNVEPYDDGLWQGDIILRKSEAEDIILRYGGELPAHRKMAAEERAKRSVLFFDKSPAQKWTSPISYTFHSSISDKATQDRIKTNLARISKAVPCLQFNFVANPLATSYFMNFRNPSAGKLSSGSCGGSAFIGMVSPNTRDQDGPAGNSINIECLMTFSDQCFIDTMIIHEIYHSLGFGHEQTRGDRDAWVKIDFTNIIPGMENNYAIDSNSSFTPYGWQYHYDSVMQYKPTTLARDRSKLVMTAIKEPVFQNTALMGNNGPICGPVNSDWDLLNRAYCMKSGCADTDIMCGWGPLQSSKCSDPAVSSKCPKTCLTGACAGGATAATNPPTTTKSPSTCSKSAAACKTNSDCCAGLACNGVLNGGMCLPACTGSASVCAADSMLKGTCPANGATPCCHWKGVCSCTFGGSCQA